MNLTSPVAQAKWKILVPPLRVCFISHSIINILLLGLTLFFNQIFTYFEVAMMCSNHERSISLIILAKKFRKRIVTLTD